MRYTSRGSTPGGTTASSFYTSWLSLTCRFYVIVICARESPGGLGGAASRTTAAQGRRCVPTSLRYPLRPRAPGLHSSHRERRHEDWDDSVEFSVLRVDCEPPQPQCRHLQARPA